jgi:glutamine cyclotransferase
MASALALLLLLSACAPQGVRQLRVEVIATYPHDTDAFTQGLLYYNGKLYESTGLYGESDLREVDLETGEVIRLRALPEVFFGEGLARVEDRLIQLTWREETAFVYDLETFNELRRFSYRGEGWGLCFDGTELYMTDGSATLFRRDPETFALRGELTVTREQNGQRQAVRNLNELECVGNYVYANVFMSEEIVQIDKRSGRVVAVIDASGLVTRAQLRALHPDPERLANAVLNGIAYHPERETFFITGKLWPTIFEVRFVAP